MMEWILLFVDEHPLLAVLTVVGIVCLFILTFTKKL